MTKMNLIFFVAILWVTKTYSAEDANAASQDIKIIADSLECDQVAGKCLAIGDAFVEKLNDPQKKTLSAERIEVFFEKDEKAKASKEKGIEAEKSHQKPKEFKAYGNVVIVINDSIIRGERATYNPDTDIAEVFDNVSVTSGKNQVTGNYGRADLKAGTYKVLNSQKRVEALIYKNDDQIKKVKK